MSSNVTDSDTTMTWNGTTYRLAACPFCGATDLACQYVQVGHVIHCNGCGANGPMDADGKTAIEMWNIRGKNVCRA